MLYIKHFGKKPKRSDIGSYPVNGQQIKGVLRPRSAGELPGTYEIHTVSEQGADLQAVVASTDDMDDDQVTDVFATAQKRHQITAMSKKAKDGEVSVVLKGGSIDDNDDSSADDAVFNSVWGDRFKNKAEDNDDEEESLTGTPAKKLKPTTVLAAAATATASTKSKLNLHADSSKPTPVKSLAKEIDTAEQVLLSVTQFKGLLGDEQRLGKVRIVRI